MTTKLDLVKLREVSKEMVLAHPHETGETLRLKVFGYTLTEVNAIAATMLAHQAQIEALREQRDTAIDMLEGAALKHFRAKITAARHGGEGNR